MTKFMNKEAALYYFFSSFGIPAYEENTVPTGEDAPEFPYLTYSVVTGSLGEECALTVNLWYRSDSWTAVNAKAEEIGYTIGRSGKVVRCDGGAIWIKRGVPFAQSMGDPDDNLIRRKYMNITAEYFTAD